MPFLSPGDNITSNHSILFSDPGNESQGSADSKTPSESRIAQLVAEILHDTFRWMLSKRGSAWAFCSPGDKKDITFLYINRCTFYIVPLKQKALSAWFAIASLLWIFFGFRDVQWSVETPTEKYVSIFKTNCIIIILGEVYNRSGVYTCAPVLED